MLYEELSLVNDYLAQIGNFFSDMQTDFLKSKFETAEELGVYKLSTLNRVNKLDGELKRFLSTF